MMENLIKTASAAGSNAAVGLDATDPTFRERPHAVLDRLRAEEPVHRDPVFDRVVLTRAADVSAVLADRGLSVDPYKSRPTAFGRLGFTEAERGRHSLVFLDDPDHSRLRKLVTQAFSARAIDAQRSRIESIATGLLDAVASRDEPFDLIAAYGAPLPILAIAAMLGIEDTEVEQFKRWSKDSCLVFLPRPTEEEITILRAAIENLNACFADAIAARRLRPRDDLISDLVSAQAGDDRLADFEIIDTCRALLVAGNVTTTDLIGNAVVALLRHPDQLARLTAEPEAWPAAIEEVLRYDPPVSAWNRQVLDDRRIGGCPVEPGQTATAMLLAANHDPELHEDPHAFDIAREHQRHHSFGGGAHFCLGASLARLEAQVALPMLFARFPRLRLAHEPQRKALPGFSGYETVRLLAA